MLSNTQIGLHYICLGVAGSMDMHGLVLPFCLVDSESLGLGTVEAAKSHQTREENQATRHVSASRTKSFAT